MAYEYSSADVQVAWSGFPIQGLVSIGISPNTDNTSYDVGMDGLVQINILPDNTASVTVITQQGSPSNMALSAALEYQNLNGSLVVGDMTVVDPSGSMLAMLKSCHIMTRPDLSLSTEAGDNPREWVFLCEDMVYLSTPSGAPEGTAQVVSFLGSL